MDEEEEFPAEGVAANAQALRKDCTPHEQRVFRGQCDHKVINEGRKMEGDEI